MFKASLRIAACGGFFVLSGCGGGGGGSQTFIPPPPQVAEAFPLTNSANFDTISADWTSQVNGAPNQVTLTSTDIEGLGPATTFSYDATSGTYSVANGANSATFNASTGSPSGNFENFTAQDGNTTDQLSLFKNVSGSSYAGIQLSYVSFGAWSHADGDTGAGQLTYFLFGYPTAASDMPRSGTATYNTTVSASEWLVGYRYPTGTTDLNGTATFSADFGTGLINTDLTLNRADDGTAVGSFAGTGSISANQFAGTFSSTDPFFTNGSFNGGFFGPGAKEMGYAFEIREHNPDPYAGAALPPLVDAWIMGAVVGTKN